MQIGSLQHIGIIMDGNGRWATRLGKNRSFGHKAGVETLVKIIEISRKWNIPFLSVYAFSTENWKRPKREISFLFHLLRKFFINHLDTLHKNGVKIIHSGERNKLDSLVLGLIDKATELTKENTSLVLNICLDYGSKTEILRATEKFYLVNSRFPSEIELDSCLYVPEIPPIDLLIRTGGERRLSNFMLWQLAYSEIYFEDVFWPDFQEVHLQKAIEWFLDRERRFGGLVKK